ncbi:hypothetical protein CANARDRAFT_61049 [[Candida] arabinofermentans NRRL YB-2248]|uniref:Uncharacterized protein n=1 Tax=[Candida] arabinofermentans NRRL YB-2248 TaxID=983967 RepID=A0A1E4SYL9_9ASCO|nr:hypothetical protein CANARDRAFT_61049 [[Candida] arabinofermentans NRRL YB-2248]
MYQKGIIWLQDLPSEIILLVYQFINLDNLLPILDTHNPQLIEPLRYLISKQIRIIDLVKDFDINLAEIHHVESKIYGVNEVVINNSNLYNYSTIFHNLENYNTLNKFLKMNNQTIKSLTIEGSNIMVCDVLQDLSLWATRFDKVHLKIDHTTSLTIPGKKILEFVRNSRKIFEHSEELNISSLNWCSHIIDEDDDVDDDTRLVYRVLNQRQLEMSAKSAMELNSNMNAALAFNKYLWDDDVTSIKYDNLTLDLDNVRSSDPILFPRFFNISNFPYLTSLKLNFNIDSGLLNKLTTIQHLEFVKLRKLQDLRLDLPLLKTLKMSNSNIENINILENLTLLELENCPALKDVRFNENLQSSLTKLYLNNCKKLLIHDPLPVNLVELSIGCGKNLQHQGLQKFNHLKKLRSLKLYTDGSIPLNLPHTITTLELTTPAKLSSNLWNIEPKHLPTSLTTLIIVNGFLSVTTSSDTLNFQQFGLKNLQKLKLDGVSINSNLDCLNLKIVNIIDCKFINGSLKIDAEIVRLQSNYNMPLLQIRCDILWYWCFIHKNMISKRMTNMIGDIINDGKPQPSNVIHVHLDRHHDQIKKLFSLNSKELIYDIRI